MVVLTVQAVVKKYKAQRNSSAKILPSEEFEGDANDFKAMLWELAESHIKGSATINGNIAEMNHEQPQIEDFSKFIVISKSNRSYTFAGTEPILRPLQPIKQAQMTTLASGDEVVQVVICVYGRKIAKQADYAKVMTALQGGENAVDRSGAPNQARIDHVIQCLRDHHSNLTGENMIWRDWATILLQRPETVEASMFQPPPPEITLLFDCQSLGICQLRKIQESLTIALDVVEGSENMLRDLKCSFSDMQDQIDRYDHSLQIHKRVISRVLQNVRPRETENSRAQFDEIPNQDDVDHLEESDQENETP
ncbi:hypothetical protein HDU78_011592 [Chytriomyces hyalinus]|nr:hypothetical protein HDU78_011592 [Chytriomyces hyalinus]